MRLPSWLSMRRTSSTIGTVTVTLTADTSAYVAGMKDAASIIRYHRAVEHERNVGRAYVGGVVVGRGGRMSMPLPPHPDDAHAAIAAELVRLTLPHHETTDRPELVAPLIEPTPRRPRRTHR